MEILKPETSCFLLNDAMFCWCFWKIRWKFSQNSRPGEYVPYEYFILILGFGNIWFSNPFLINVKWFLHIYVRLAGVKMISPSYVCFCCVLPCFLCIFLCFNSTNCYEKNCTFCGGGPKYTKQSIPTLKLCSHVARQLLVALHTFWRTF